MSEIRLPLIEIELVAVTRAALGVGIGLLMAARLSKPQRQVIGWSLVALGGLTTFPLRSDVLRRKVRTPGSFDQPSLAKLRGR
jgi:hypothetical protein